MSWVTITSDRSRSRLSFPSRSTTSCAVSLSRSPVGSSAQMIAGSFTSARAIVTLALATGELLWTVPAVFGEAHEPECLGRPLPCIPLGHTAHQQRELHVLDRGEDGDQVVELEDEAHAAGP